MAALAAPAGPELGPEDLVAVVVLAAVDPAAQDAADLAALVHRIRKRSSIARWNSTPTRTAS